MEVVTWSVGSQVEGMRGGFVKDYECSLQEAYWTVAGFRLWRVICYFGFAIVLTP